MKIVNFSYVAMLLCVTGCTTNPPAQGKVAHDPLPPSDSREAEEKTGGSIVTGDLHNRAVRRILEVDLSNSQECTETRKITIKAIAYDEPGVLTERWSVERCGSVVFYIVQYIPTPQGRAEVSVTVDK